MFTSNDNIDVNDHIMSLDLAENTHFSELPEDICLLVFELIAELDQDTRRSCALVSRKVNAW